MGAYSAAAVVEFAGRAGKIMLENGAEIYRVEQTTSCLCRAYGIADCECYATPTMLIVSTPDDGEGRSVQMLRISFRMVNLGKVAAVNDLSRALMRQSIPLGEAAERMKRIDRLSPYRFPVTLLAASLGTGAFTLVFGGQARDFVCGLLLGAVIHLLNHILHAKQIGDFTVNLSGGAAAALGGWMMSHLGLVNNEWIVTISSLMLLVPGLLFTNAFQDIAAGDLVSGVSRGIEASGIAAALASGAAVAYFILMWIGGALC